MIFYKYDSVENLFAYELFRQMVQLKAIPFFCLKDFVSDFIVFDFLSKLVNSSEVKEILFVKFGPNDLNDISGKYFSR